MKLLLDTHIWRKVFTWRLTPIAPTSDGDRSSEKRICDRASVMEVYRTG
ncbi:hypothetical protein [Microseira wollei]|uniref:Uncharacterized protein n=1 Tax=Microseira wollei NIES-4236 TaxID=2530354 RepID=A0AAV3XFG6_9CYAN|nr:hypothetical protein [Microseira wollei]GET40610.1 hypothetical protein MiSe_54210 [Microseira wollei NIES-4236]